MNSKNVYHSVTNVYMHSSVEMQSKYKSNVLGLYSVKYTNISSIRFLTHTLKTDNRN